LRLILSRGVPLALAGILATATGFGLDPLFNVVVASQEPAASLAPLNEPPRLTFIPNQSIATDPSTGALLLNTGTTLVIIVSATDPNPQDDLTLTAFFGVEGVFPAGATFTQIGSGTGVFTWTPGASHEGVWSPSNATNGKPPLTLRVRDNGGPQLQGSQQVTISIGPSANVSPRLNLYEKATLIGLDSPILATEGDSIEFDLYCSDDNSGDVLSLQPSATTPLSLGATLTKVPTGHDNPVRYAFLWNVQTGQAGTGTIDFVCQDSGAPMIDERRRVVMEIAGPTSPPRILAISPDAGPPAGGTTVTITGTAFGATTDVQFGGASVPFTAVDAVTVSLATTAGVTGALVDIGLTTPFGVATRAGAFQYRDFADTDRDGIADCVEGTGNPDGDSRANLNDTDSDGDGIADRAEAIGPADQPTVSAACGGVSFAIADTDGDGAPDFLDLDSDNDGISDRFEGPSDMDMDGRPNYRDLDSDGDGAAEANDNCPSSPNANQADVDSDGVGDVCDFDSDNDGLSNAEESVHGTNPGLHDTDGDGLSDGEEVFISLTNPVAADTDGGGMGDGIEIAGGSNPLDAADDDSTPPVMTIAAPAVVEATSGAGAIVTYSASAIDGLDGAVAVTCSPESGSTFAVGSTTVRCEAHDGEGNRATAEVTIEVADTTPPVLTLLGANPVTLEGGMPFVDLGATAADTVAGDLTAAIVVSSSVDTAVVGTYAVTYTVSDPSANTATATRTVNVVDTTPPLITMTAPQATAYALNDTVVANYTCVDTVSGVAACAGPVPSGSAIDTASPGSRMFTVTASDRAGNVTTRSVGYTVVYGACLLYDPARAARAGSTIPIRFQLCDGGGQNVSNAATTVTAVQVVKISDSSTSEVADAGDANPDSNFRFDASLGGGGGGYIFNLKTSGLSPGKYVVVYEVQGDQTMHASDLVFYVR
jgi:hypothetical protein